jgi:hypothetical protein
LVRPYFHTIQTPKLSKPFFPLPSPPNSQTKPKREDMRKKKTRNKEIKEDEEEQT